jgi:hypothetical protein
MGLIQVLTDPRTTLAQSLNAILTAELTDNAGWELLAQLAEEAGESELTGKFLGALSQEQEHLLVIKAWLATLVSERAGTEAVYLPSHSSSTRHLINRSPHTDRSTTWPSTSCKTKACRSRGKASRGKTWWASPSASSTTTLSPRAHHPHERAGT